MSTTNTTVLQVWVCKHCGYMSLRVSEGLPCINCLRRAGWNVRTYIDATAGP